MPDNNRYEDSYVDPITQTPGIDNTSSGFVALRDLLPDGLLDAYDTSGFDDLLNAQFDTSLLDITKESGQNNIFSTISEGQSSFMQVPGQEAKAGASGFGQQEEALEI